MSFNRKTIALIIIACLCTIIISVRSAISSKIVFCDVGQGAATLLQLGTYQIIIDTGPDQRVLSCIGKYIPFFDHAIEVVIISHNQKDHDGGLRALQKKYKIEHVYGPSPKASYISSSQFTEVKNTIELSVKKSMIIMHKASQSSTNANDSANVVTLISPPHIVFLSSDINGVELKLSLIHI